MTDLEDSVSLVDTLSLSFTARLSAMLVWSLQGSHRGAPSWTPCLLSAGQVLRSNPAFSVAVTQSCLSGLRSCRDCAVIYLSVSNHHCSRREMRYPSPFKPVTHRPPLTAWLGRGDRCCITMRVRKDLNNAVEREAVSWECYRECVYCTCKTVENYLFHTF